MISVLLGIASLRKAGAEKMLPLNEEFWGCSQTGAHRATTEQLLTVYDGSTASNRGAVQPSASPCPLAPSTYDRPFVRRCDVLPLKTYKLKMSLEFSEKTTLRLLQYTFSQL